MPFEVGQSVGDYEILAVLGKGGMGAVYRVRNTISNRVEAMKVLLADVGAQAELGDRFVSEIRTLARLEHPNIAKFHTAFKVENQLVMVMEFVEGFTLSDFADQAAIPIDQVLSYISQTLSALTCAHVNGVVHRDIKPSNIMVTPHGIVKLMDFGIAKSNLDPNLTRTGTTIGSVRYMSPEQVRGANVDARSDLYSLGIVLYELTAGKRPFESENTFDILNAHLNVAPTPPIQLNPQLPQALNEIILLAIEKDPERRFQTAAAFHNALENVRQKRNSVPAQPAKVGSERDRTTAMPSSLPYAQTIVDSGVSANPGTAGSQHYVHTIVERGPGNRPNQPVTHQSSDFKPQQQGMSGPPIYVEPAPAAKKGNRGLWMAAGAIACVCVLGGAIYILPNLLKSPAASSGKPDSGQRDASVTPKPTPISDTTPSAGTPSHDRATAVNPPPAKQQVAINSSGVHRTPQMTKTDSAPQQAAPPPGPPQTSVAPPPTQQPAAQPAISQEDMDKAGEDLMKLRARADAVRSSLDNLRAQQASQGLGLRQDIAAAASRMDSYLQESDHALQSGRLDFARKNMEHADEEITKIEAFFAR